MSVAWFGYALAVSAAGALLALALELILRRARWQSRGVWLAAALVSALVALAPVRAAVGHTRPGASREAVTVVVAADALQPGPGSGDEAAAPSAVQLDLQRRIPGAAQAWLALSLLVLVAFGGSAWRVKRALSRAKERELAGRGVWVSDGFGPAAIGLLRGRIVVPEEVLDRLDGATLEWVIEHEHEHLRGQDVRALWLMAALLVAVPWNLAMWWHASRLARAIELDCDLRLLRRRRDRLDRRTYGTLLLDMVRVSAVPVIHPALARRAVLRERLAQIAGDTPSRRRVLHSTFVAAAALAPILAFQRPPVPGVQMTDARADEAFEGRIVAGRWRDMDAYQRAIDAALARRDGRGIRGAVALAARTDGNGSIRHLRVDAVTGPTAGTTAIDAAVASVADLELDVSPEDDGWVAIWLRSSTTAASSPARSDRRSTASTTCLTITPRSGGT